MQEDFRLILDLVTVLAAAAAGGLLASLLRQPVLLGYLLGGVAIGPAGLGWIKELVQVETLAQFGVAFLLFALGVEFSLTELQKVRGIALGGGALQIFLTIAVATAILPLVGWADDPVQGIFLGATLSLSSTAVVLKTLMERNQAETPHGQVMLGILVVQDLALGLMLAVLPALNASPEELGLTVGWALLKILAFGLAAVAAARWAIPPLLRFLARRESDELFLLGVVALCLGIAILTDRLGFSIEMGAFVAGLTISEVEYADQTLTYVEPLRDVFAALFFVAVGTLIDPLFLWEHLDSILGFVALAVLGKSLIVIPVVRLFGYDLKTSILVGLGLAQIGEFSFVLASKGQTMGLVSESVYLSIAGTTALTLVLTPFILQGVPLLLNWMESQPALQPYFEGTSTPHIEPEDSVLEGHVVVCGYGNVGRNLVGRLRETPNCPVLAIDRSEAAIAQARTDGIAYLYGNASSLRVLDAAELDRARTMAIALPDAMSTRLCLKRALELAPDLDIVVQANQVRDIELLYQLGAKEVVQPEFEGSLELLSHLLAALGLSPFRIQREVEQIRNSHYLELRPQREPDRVARELQVAAQELNSRWLSLPTGSPLAGMTLEQTNLRQLTGVTLMAIQRQDGEEIDYPDATMALLPKDRLLVVGDDGELAAFQQLATGEVAVPDNRPACLWLEVPEHSLAVDRTLAELDWRRRFRVQVRSIRREGRFVRFPHGETHVRSGDRLLLCGKKEQIDRLREWTMSAESVEEEIVSES
ncbi:cation:proton antiporter domain-containing protein [Baaleninema simplex]|uniref:cation:proton antiporter domain-containing protein n=1 Tax=Baaleninema simplex TaxID=2862350 RepID=UPI000345C49A|nr:cation:proton antiporter [Baaleninema simplex]